MPGAHVSNVFRSATRNPVVEWPFDDERFSPRRENFLLTLRKLFPSPKKTLPKTVQQKRAATEVAALF
jgi:hypothetical protein